MRPSITAALLVTALLAAPTVTAQTEYWYDQDPLPQGMTAEEELRRHEIGQGFRASAPPSGTVRNIAEFERNEAVLIRYPLGIPMSLVVAMAEHVRVITIVSGQTQQNQATSAYQSNGVNMANVEFLVAPTNSMWTRDYGPFYIVTEDHEVSIVDFVYNRPRPADNLIPAALANHLDVPIYSMDLVHTGGNYMTDGLGISASFDLVWEENDFNQLLVLSEMGSYLGVDTYHVTIDPTGHMSGPNLLKHIDTYAKFLDVDKIIIAQVPPSDSRYAEYEEVADYFEQSVSAWGTPFQVFRVFSPNDEPYANSLILNERIYVPQANTAWDEAAIQAYQEAMPGYEVLGFSFGSWLPSDALHCRVKEIADRGMLHLSHVPVQGEVPYQPEIEVEVEIVPYSGEPLIDDELYLIFRAGEAAFDTLALGHAGGHTFSASIPVGEEDDQITYYFSAADASGRTETWPLIGPEGARSFTVDLSTVSIEPIAGTGGVELDPAYPNPSSQIVTLGYRLDTAGEVRLEVFDLLGRRVATVVDELVTAGRHEARLDVSSLPSGMYYYRIIAGEASDTRTLVVAR